MEQNILLAVQQHLFTTIKYQNSDIANGGFALASASSVYGAGASYSKATVGRLFQHGSVSGPVYGFDISAGFFMGSSTVTNVKIEDCCDKNE